MIAETALSYASSCTWCLLILPEKHKHCPYAGKQFEVSFCFLASIALHNFLLSTYMPHISCRRQLETAFHLKMIVSDLNPLLLVSMSFHYILYHRGILTGLCATQVTPYSGKPVIRNCAQLPPNGNHSALNLPLHLIKKMPAGSPVPPQAMNLWSVGFTVLCTATSAKDLPWNTREGHKWGQACVLES